MKDTISEAMLPRYKFATRTASDEILIAGTYSGNFVSRLIRQCSKHKPALPFPICAIETELSESGYPPGVKYVLNARCPKALSAVADAINRDRHLAKMILLYDNRVFGEVDFVDFARRIEKPLLVVVPPGVSKNTEKQLTGIAEAVLCGSGAIISVGKSLLSKASTDSLTVLFRTFGYGCRSGNYDTEPDITALAAACMTLFDLMESREQNEMMTSEWLTA